MSNTIHKDIRKDFHLKLFKNPYEIVLALGDAAKKKSEMAWYKLMLLGIIAGFYVGIGATVGLQVAGGMNSTLYQQNPGLSKVIFGSVFPIALVMIIIVGGELFTGNTMFFTIGMMQKKVTILQLLASWGLAYISNYAGCVIYAGLMYGMGIGGSSPYLAFLDKLAIDKVLHSGWGVLFIKGIGCNIMVCVAIYIAVGAEDLISKIVGSWLALITFVFTGYEHSIANIFVIHLAMFNGSVVPYGEFLWKHLLPVTLGNIIGGSIIIGLVYGFIYSPDMKIPCLDCNCEDPKRKKGKISKKEKDDSSKELSIKDTSSKENDSKEKDSNDKDSNESV